MIWIFCILGGVAVPFVLVDFVFHFFIWQSRIKIGHLQDEPWQEAVQKRGLHWLLFDAKARKDSSITAVMGRTLSHLPPSLQTEATAKVALMARRYLQKVTRRNGAIDFSLGNTKGISVYAQTFEVLPFTQGFALRITF